MALLASFARLEEDMAEQIRTDARTDFATADYVDRVLRLSAPARRFSGHAFHGRCRSTAGRRSEGVMFA